MIFCFLVVGESEERIRFMPFPSELNKVSINRLNWNLKSLCQFHFTYQGTILSVYIFFTSVEHNYFVWHQNRYHWGRTGTQYLHIKQITFLFNSIHFESKIFSCRRGHLGGIFEKTKQKIFYEFLSWDTL